MTTLLMFLICWFLLISLQLFVAIHHWHNMCIVITMIRFVFTRNHNKTVAHHLSSSAYFDRKVHYQCYSTSRHITQDLYRGEHTA